MAAIRGDKTVAEIAQQYDVYPNQIEDWKKRPLSEAEHVFENGNAHASNNSDVEVQKLHAKIGELTMEQDFSYGRFSQVARIKFSLYTINGILETAIT